MESVTRRGVLVGACVTCAAVVAACGDMSGGGSGNGPKAAPAKGTALGPTSDVPVGGGKVYPDANVVVTQPTAGTFRGFSATCTHQGCQVGKVEDGTIDCPCHGSMFAIADGSVVHGPAARPLAAANVTVDGTQIVTA